MQHLPKNLLLLAVSAVLLLFSCKKNDGPPAPPLLPKVKSINDQVITANYTYDTKGRLIKYDNRSNAGNSSKEYRYTDTVVSVKDYDPNGIYLGTTTYRLNARGLAISMTDPATSAYQTYTYNSDNQVLTLQVRRTTAGVVYHWDYHYYYNRNGDLDSSTVWASATGLTTVTYYPQYDINKPTTLGNENIGLSFLGSSSKHPLLQTKAQDGTTLFSYTYTYDSRGRVTTQKTSIGGVAYLSFSITYYQ